MPNSYAHWQSVDSAPPWLQLVPPGGVGSYGVAWNAAFGAMKDELVSRMIQAVYCKFPLRAPPDALQLLGSERGIIRGVNETNSAYAGRVARAWDSWQWAGTAFGVLSQLFAIGYTSTVIMSRGVTWSLNAAGQLNTPTQQPKEVTPYWSRFVVIVPHPWPSSWLSSGNWAAPTVVGSGTGTVSAIAGVPNPDTDYVIKVSTGGAPGTGQYQVSTDHGVTFGSATTIAASGNVLGAGVTFSASGTFTLNDRYYLSQIPPGDSSQDANIFRAVVAQWKPATAKCTAMTVLQTGRLIGYPARTLGASNGVLGGCTVTQWTPPAN